MKFYNREKELATLRDIEASSKDMAQMTVMVGRRRVGKTTLLKRAFEKSTTLYFFVAKKMKCFFAKSLYAKWKILYLYI